MSHIYLIGFMGSGKSTVGSLLARTLSLPFVDLDAAIVDRAGRSIPEIFADEGEEGFREREHRALVEIAHGSRAVVSCGGGILARGDNLPVLHDGGTVIYLRTTAEESVARISDLSSRPLLAGTDPLGDAERLLAKRAPAYSEAADIEIDTIGHTPAEVVSAIVSALGSEVTEPVIVRVGVEGSPYDVIIGPHVLERVGELVRGVSSARKVAVITDEHVAELYGLDVTSRLITAGFDARALTVAAGESSKSWAHAGELLEALAEMRLDRGDLVVALGGGVVGDLVGFTAATYLRGIDFVQIPTSLLAQVDSSVGGKTGVDLRAGKNLAGAFKQPKLVIADTAVLGTLPASEWESGFAEIAKSAVLDGDEFTSWLESHSDALLEHDEAAVMEAVRRSVEFKSGVVAADEREAGLRECLNYGHTFGHALEKVAGYGTYTHGHAVAEGMRFAIRLAAEAISTDRALVRRQDALLDSLGLGPIAESYEPSALLEAMHSDKKAKAGAVRFVLLSAVGTWECRAVDENMIREHVVAWAASKRGAV